MKLLIALAGMPYATATLRLGKLLADLLSAQVTLLTVIEEEEQRPQAEATQRAAQDLLQQKPGTLDLVIRLGSPSKQIIREARKGDYALLVLGERHDRAAPLRLSRTVKRVLKKASAPVVVAKGQRSAFHRVLICTSGRDVALPVIQWGAQVARAAGAEATILYVTRPLPSMYTGLSGMEEQLAELLQSNTPVARHLARAAALLDSMGVVGKLALRQGAPAAEILKEAEHGAYDLIVVGSWPRAQLIRGLFTGDIAREVIDNADRPVLVVSHAGHQNTSSSLPLVD